MASEYRNLRLPCRTGYGVSRNSVATVRRAQGRRSFHPTDLKTCPWGPWPWGRDGLKVSIPVYIISGNAMTQETKP